MSPRILRVLIALLVGICFSLGEVLIIDTGPWEQPLGFVLVALSTATIASFVIEIPAVLYRTLTGGKK